jgi:hypothetical protein
VRSTSLGRKLIEMRRSQSIHHNLGLKIPNLNLLIRSSAQPITVGRETKRMNNLTRIQGVKTLSLIQIPKHGSSVLSSRSTERSIGRDTDGVEVSSVSNKVVTALAVAQGPYLHKTIPSTRNNERNLNGG